MIRTLLSLSLLTGFLIPATANPWSDYFTFENIALPGDLDPQIGGLDTLPDGRLIATFHRGEVMIYDPKAKTWSTFAEGLHEPLGIVVLDQHSIAVMQRPELTRITDTDKDGTADLYETLYDGFGMTGNYHEFAFGPARDSEGNLFISLGVASNGAGIRPEIRGEWSKIGELDTREKMLGGKDWRDRKKGSGRMYSRVPYRGWVMKIPADGSPAVPYACGFRSPDGIGFDADGRLLITDNQGDWLGTSKLYHVKKDHFYGHPASLVWKDSWDGRDPLKMKITEIDALRTPAAGLFPQGELSSSPTEPIAVPDGSFGPFAGQTLIGEMNLPNLVRYLPDPGFQEISQGTTIAFIQGKDELGIGNHRMTFDSDGALWVGKTKLSWGGSRGLVRIAPKKSLEDALALNSIQLLPDGFQLGFSQALDPSALGTISLKRHTYDYNSKYGSKKRDETDVVIGDRTLSADGQTVTLKTSDIRETYLYTFDLRHASIRSTSGKPLLGNVAYYHLVKKAPQP